MSYSVDRLAESKLLIMYLIEKIGIAVSNSEICQFVLEQNVTDYFSVQQYISDLVNLNYIDSEKDGNTTRYTLTAKGKEVLHYFFGYISPYLKKEVKKYINKNGQRIRREFEVTANYYPEIDDDYIVKCGVYDNSGICLMEINLNVPTKLQAANVCLNWKKNVEKIYASVFEIMVDYENKIDVKNSENNY